MGNAEAVAREAVYAWMRFAPGGQPSPHEINRLIDEIAEALTCYAAEQVRVTWEAAAKYMEGESKCLRSGFIKCQAICSGECDTAQEFRRRARGES